MKKLSPSSSVVPWAFALVLVVAVLATYAPALRGGFIWDDDEYVRENVTLRSVEGLTRIWTELGATPQYYPLVFTTFWIEYHLWRLHPLGYHIVNVSLHILAALLLRLVLLRLAIPGAWLAAALFALHPVHVESVAWITERKNVLSGVFFLASLLAYGRFCGWGTTSLAAPGRVRHYGFALVWFLCALWSKTVTCSLPAVILLLLWWKRTRISRRDTLPLIPLFALGIALASVTAWMEKHHVGAQGAAWDLSGLERFLIAGRAIWFYLGKLVWPVNLTFVYPKWAINAHDWSQYLYPVAAIGLVIVLWSIRKRIGKAPLVAALYFGGTLLPALGFFNTYPMRYYYVADHFQYLASIGPIALFASALAGRSFTGQRLSNVGKIARTAADTRHWRLLLPAVLLVAFAALTWRQSRIYRDRETLYRDTLAKNPSAAMAHNNLGEHLANKGFAVEALDHFRQAARIDPEFGEAQYNIGTALSGLGRTEEAIGAYRQAIRIDPRNLSAYTNLGNAYLEIGSSDAAIEQYLHVLRVDPHHVDANANLGIALSRQGKVLEAIAQYHKALATNPRHVFARNNLALALMKLGRLDEAVAEYRAVLRLDPTLADGHFNLASALLARGNIAEAVASYREALRLNPSDLEAQRALEAALVSLNKATP